MKKMKPMVPLKLATRALSDAGSVGPTLPRVAGYALSFGIGAVVSSFVLLCALLLVRIIHAQVRTLRTHTTVPFVYILQVYYILSCEYPTRITSTPSPTHSLTRSHSLRTRTIFDIF